MRDEQTDKEIRGWFKEHKASLCILNEDGRALWWLRWKKPGTIIYWIDYIMAEDGRLMVTGDLGAAIYQWRLDSAFQADPLAFVASCDLGYFAGKCVASERGRKYTQWCESKAKAALEAWIEEEEDAEQDYRRAIVYSKAAAICALDAIVTEADWNDWLGEFGDEAFGADYPEWSSIGLEIDYCCRAHLIGLKMAMEQAKETGHVEPA